MRMQEWTVSGRSVAEAALPLCVLVGVAAVTLTSGNGIACAVAGGVLLYLAGFGAGPRRLERVRVRAAQSARGPG